MNWRSGTSASRARDRWLDGRRASASAIGARRRNASHWSTRSCTTSVPGAPGANRRDATATPRAASDFVSPHVPDVDGTQRPFRPHCRPHEAEVFPSTERQQCRDRCGTRRCARPNSGRARRLSGSPAFAGEPAAPRRTSPTPHIGGATAETVERTRRDRRDRICRASPSPCRQRFYIQRVPERCWSSTRARRLRAARPPRRRRGRTVDAQLHHIFLPEDALPEERPPSTSPERLERIVENAARAAITTSPVAVTDSGRHRVPRCRRRCVLYRDVDARAAAEGMAIDAARAEAVYCAMGHLPSLMQAPHERVMRASPGGRWGGRRNAARRLAGHAARRAALREPRSRRRTGCFGVATGVPAALADAGSEACPTAKSTMATWRATSATDRCWAHDASGRRYAARAAWHGARRDRRASRRLERAVARTSSLVFDPEMHRTSVRRARRGHGAQCRDGTGGSGSRTC
jgi:hypothetical protein